MRRPSTTMRRAAGINQSGSLLESQPLSKKLDQFINFISCQGGAGNSAFNSTSKAIMQ